MTANVCMQHALLRALAYDVVPPEMHTYGRSTCALSSNKHAAYAHTVHTLLLIVVLQISLWYCHRQYCTCFATTEMQAYCIRTAKRALMRKLIKRSLLEVAVKSAASFINRCPCAPDCDFCILTSQSSFAHGQQRAERAAPGAYGTLINSR
jgi:hypothetical protein